MDMVRTLEKQLTAHTRQGGIEVLDRVLRRHQLGGMAAGFRSMLVHAELQKAQRQAADELGDSTNQLMSRSINEKNEKDGEIGMLREQAEASEELSEMLRRQSGIKSVLAVMKKQGLLQAAYGMRMWIAFHERNLHDQVKSKLLKGAARGRAMHELAHITECGLLEMEQNATRVVAHWREVAVMNKAGAQLQQLQQQIAELEQQLTDSGARSDALSGQSADKLWVRTASRRLFSAWKEVAKVGVGSGLANDSKLRHAKQHFYHMIGGRLRGTFNFWSRITLDRSETHSHQQFFLEPTQNYSRMCN